MFTWVAGNHLWASIASDGISFPMRSGAPDPALIDHARNDIDVWPFFAPAGAVLSVCEDAKGDTIDGIFLFAKNDVDGLRLHARTQLRLP